MHTSSSLVHSPLFFFAMGLYRMMMSTKEIRSRKAVRPDRNAALGYLWGIALVGLMVFYLTGDATDEAFKRRGLLDIFYTESSKCQDEPSWLIAPLLIGTVYSFVGLAIITDEYFGTLSVCPLL